MQGGNGSFQQFGTPNSLLPGAPKTDPNFGNPKMIGAFKAEACSMCQRLRIGNVNVGLKIALLLISFTRGEHGKTRPNTQGKGEYLDYAPEVYHAMFADGI